MKRTFRIIKNSLARFALDLQFSLKNKSPRVFTMIEVRDFDKPNLYIGETNWVLSLLKRGIDLETLETKPGGKTASLGFNRAENKWYGWSHRAIYGFGIGSEVRPGELAFVPSNRREYIDELLRWYLDGATDLFQVNIAEKEEYILLTRAYLGGRVKEDHLPLDIEYGRGQWTATTLDEAKQMALDFAKAVD
jgi:hypothetical protein